MELIKKRKKRIRSGSDSWGALKKVLTKNRYYVTVYPCKPFKHGHGILVPKDHLPSFDVQDDLSKKQKYLILQFTGGVWNLTVLRALLIERCNTENVEDLTWKDILTEIELHLSKTESNENN